MKNGSPNTSLHSTTSETSATRKAYLALRRMIVVGELQPGEKLKIDRLRKILDTGASPVREALSLLTSDLLVERLDQRGFIAAETSRENFVEILTLRCELEEMALRQSIANADETWEDALVLSHHKMTREAPDDLEVFEARHKAFHMALLSNSGSPILMRFCSQLYNLNVRYRYLAGKALDYQRRDVSSEHLSILQAAVDRNADLASERLLNHYRQTGAFLNGLFSQKQDES